MQEKLDYMSRKKINYNFPINFSFYPLVDIPYPLHFTDLKTDSEMKSFHDFIQELELRQMKYLGLNEETCDLYNSQIRQDKDGKYDPYLLVKVPFKNNRYEVDICNKDSSVCSITNIYNFTKMKCDIFIDKIWKYNDTYICKWKVRKVLLV